MANITLNIQGTWTASVQVQVGQGQSREFRAEDLVSALAGSFERQPASQGAGDAPGPTVAQALDRYLREVSTRKAANTCRAERGRAIPLARDLGTKRLAELTSRDVADYRDKRLAEPAMDPDGRSTHARSPSGVKLELILLSHLFRVAAQEWQVIPSRNPVRDIRLPTPAPGRTRRLSEQERVLIESEMTRRGERMLLLAFKLALDTGMRFGEIRTLTWAQVDLEGRIIHLPKTKNGTERDVPLTQRVVKALQSARRQAPELGSQWVFPGTRKADGTRRTFPLEFHWWELKRKIGIKDLRFHDLRHEALSRLVEAGLSDLEVATISGHKSIQMLKRYTHLRAKDLVHRLDELHVGDTPRKRTSGAKRH